MYKHHLLLPDLLLCTLWLWAVLGERYTWSSPVELVALVAVFQRIVVAFLLQKSEIRTWLPLGIMSVCLSLLMGGGIFPGLDILVRYPFVVHGIDRLEPEGYGFICILITAWLWGLPVIIYLVQLFRRRLKKTDLRWGDLLGAILWKNRKAGVYAGLLLISIAALYAGLAMNARVCRFVCLAAPAISYWLLCRHYQVRNPKMGLLLAGMFIFYYAQVFSGALRLAMLGISLVIVAYLGIRLFRIRQGLIPLLTTVLYIGIGLPLLSIGYNQYTGIAYPRVGFGSMEPYDGIFFITDATKTYYGLRDRYGILVEPKYEHITPKQTHPTFWYQQVELEKDGETDVYDLWRNELHKSSKNVIPTEERIINRQEDLRAYFDSLCQHTEARLWIHRPDDPDTLQVWKAIDELTLFARGERMAYPAEEVTYALRLMGWEQAYLEAHEGWQESTWKNKGPNPGELFLSHFMEKAVHYCPRIELLTEVHSKDKKVGAINFPSWSGQPFLSILLYRDGKGLGIKSVTKGTFEPTEITEITRIEDVPQNLYRLHTSGDDIYTYDLDSKELIPE